MSDLIFSISQTFSQDVREGALGKYEATKFFIAPYQRGYKWSSETPNSPVQLLMSDLIDAFSSKPKEYYLQFITVAKDEKRKDMLEVIDGQQRLTTITLLFSVMNYKLKCNDKPFTDSKLSYEVRKRVSEFLENYIYKDVRKIIEISWDDLIADQPQYDEQDIYYLFYATKKINEMLPKENLQEFYDYVANKVMLIVNKVEKTITCERIFSNLNTNKVELTSAELIKGLLLTKSARENDVPNRATPYREILEQRTSMGRQWDEIDNWANNPKIQSFYFNQVKDPIHELLLLIALKDEFKPPKNKDKYYLFNYFQSKIKKGEQTAKGYFFELKQLKCILNDWFIDPKIYNLLGFLIIAKGSKDNTTSFIDKIKLQKEILIKTLVEKVKGLIPTEIEKLSYGDNNDEIYNLLLALSVFGNKERFDFYSFKKNEWSLEHIFPQNPKKISSKLEQSDIILINSIIGERINDNSFIDLTDKTHKELKLRDKLARKLKQETCILNEDELNLLCNMLQSKSLNRIGNMALLTKSDNSSNGNGMFDAKRINIVQRVSSGRFVPKHTYDVFSKLISKKMNPNLTIWSEQDIISHEEWIQVTINNQLFKGE